MAIREELIASAVKFLQDPSVSSSSIESKIAFLQSKHLTKEEVDEALARAGAPPSHAVAPSYPPPPPSQPYGGYQQPVPYGWQQQQQAPPVPKRDWRDWFIMATVVGGVGFGLYSLTQRYIVPLIAPPTPEKLTEDKKSIDDKFDRAFALIDQLSADTTELKNAEQARTERLDKAMSDLETVITDLKLANRRRDDDAQRVRDDVQSLRDAIPRAVTAQKDQTDTRLRDLNNELKSLKTLLSQRMAAAPAAASTSSPAAASSLLKPNGVPAASSASTPATTLQPASVQDEAKEVNGKSPAAAPTAADYVSSLGRSSPFSSSGMPAGKAAIPAWQMAMQTKSTTAAPEAGSSNGEGASGSGS